MADDDLTRIRARWHERQARERGISYEADATILSYGKRWFTGFGQSHFIVFLIGMRFDNALQS